MSENGRFDFLVWFVQDILELHSCVGPGTLWSKQNRPFSLTNYRLMTFTFPLKHLISLTTCTCTQSLSLQPHHSQRQQGKRALALTIQLDLIVSVTSSNYGSYIPHRCNVIDSDGTVTYKENEQIISIIGERDK
jgi:hypothetical protein